MIKFLIYVAIILTVFAIGYLVRVFELASGLKGNKPHIITEKDNRLNGRIMLTFLVVFFLFVIWNLKSFVPLTLPKSASEHGDDLDWLFNFNMAILFIVFTLTHILLFYFAYKYYGRDNNRATYFPHSNKLEMIWTVIPAIVLAVIIIFGLRAWNKITAKASDDAIVIQLYAKQFDWTARYAGADNKLGDSNYKLITDENALGMDEKDAKGADDIVVRNEFHIPVGKEIEFKLNAREVIHSAFMPHFRAQMNCVPGMTTMLHFTPTVTTEEMRKDPYVIELMKGINEARAKRGEKPEEFNYMLLCNKICGNSHYNMQMTIIVESEADYNKWLSSQKPFFAKK
ncbi:MAG: cytochrome c oxidase subunit II [Bacteroidia bacterium]|jgi:cytochrome c oxidase subunit 2